MRIQQHSDPTLPLVSVVLCTFNQQRFIREAIQSILRQRAEFSFEIVVADDASKDKTIDIIRYEAVSFDNITYCISDENSGVSETYRRAFAVCRGKYISILEGDDFWSSPHKLADQVEFLERHWECPAVFSQTCFLFPEHGTFEIRPEVPPGRGFTYFNAADVIRGDFVRRSAGTYRADLLARVPSEYPDLLAYDWLLNIWIAQHGPIAFLADLQAVQRIHRKGRWFRIKHRRKLALQTCMIDDLLVVLNGRYEVDLKTRRAALERDIANVRASVATSDPPSDRKTIVRVWYDLARRLLTWILNSVVPPAAKRRLGRILPERTNASR